MKATCFNIDFQVLIQATDSALLIYTLESVILKMSPGDSDTLTGLGAIHVGHRN